MHFDNYFHSIYTALHVMDNSDNLNYVVGRCTEVKTIFYKWDLNILGLGYPTGGWSLSPWDRRDSYSLNTKDHQVLRYSCYPNN
jgi:hypothetical protein